MIASGRGWVQPRLDGPRGRTLTVWHAEVLVEEEADYTTLRMAKATDRYVFADSGPEQVEPRFIYHGFRYAEIKGLKEARLSPNDVRAVAVHNDMRRTGWFETSDPLLNQLHSNVAWSMRVNSWAYSPTARGGTRG